MINAIILLVVSAEGPHKEGIQKLKLVRRPTERDIFWDETTGERLDLSCLLEPKSLTLLSEEMQQNHAEHSLEWKAEESDQRNHTQSPKDTDKGTIQQSEHRGMSLDENLSWTNECEIGRTEHKTHRDIWLWSDRSCQTGGIRGAREIWDHKLD